MATANLPSWFRIDSDVPTPKSTTQEALEGGLLWQADYFKGEEPYRKPPPNSTILNFRSYPLKVKDKSDYITFFDQVDDRSKCSCFMTTYQRDFSVRKPLICKDVYNKATEEPDPFWNRKPKNDFEKTRRVRSKFLDDHLTNVSPTRKKINFLRQLRNTSFEFGYDE